MDTLTEEILASAKPTPKNQGWFDVLSSDHQNAILDVRRQWRQTADSSGVSASQMARTIIAKLVERGYKISGYRKVQRWLTQG
jgi:hypothetical protein